MKLDIGKILLKSVKIISPSFRQQNIFCKATCMKISLLTWHHMHSDQSYWSFEVTASHKTKPSSVTRHIVDLYSTLGHVGGGNSCGGYTLMGVSTTHWLTSSGLPKPRWTVSCRGLHCTGVEIAVSLTICLGNQAAPHCM